MQIINDGQWFMGLDSLSFALPQGAYQWGQNVVNRGGIISTRQGLAEVWALSQKDPRGLTIATLHNIPFLIAAIDDKVYQLNLTQPNAILTPIKDISFPTNTREVHFELCVQALERRGGRNVSITPRYVVVMQDGISDPQYWDGVKSGKIKLVYPEEETTPKGEFMKWIGDRLWVVKDNKMYASDLLNPLQFEEQSIEASGGFFFLPGHATGMGITQDYKTLLVMTDYTTSSFQVGLEDRTVWPNTQDFQRVIFPNIGCISHRTIVNQYGLTWWMSHDGLVALDSALQTYRTSKMEVRDQNMSRSKEGVKWSNGGGCAGTFGNFLWFSMPSGSKYNVHTWVIDQSVVESLGANTPPVWCANWTGIRPEQWVTADVRGTQRCFCISRDLTNTGHQATIWEAFIGQRMDVPNIGNYPLPPVPEPPPPPQGPIEPPEPPPEPPPPDPNRIQPRAKDIACCFETKFIGLSPSMYMKLRWIEVDLAEIIGKVHVQVYYCGRRTSYKRIINKKINATVSPDNQEIFEPDSPIHINVPQYRTIRSNTDTHERDDINSEVQHPYNRNLDREFSVLFTWTGSMSVTGVRVCVDEQTDYAQGRVEKDENLARRINAEGEGSIGALLAPDNSPSAAVTSQYLAPMRPRWVEFPSYDSATPNGVFFVAELLANPPESAHPSNQFPLTVHLSSETSDAQIRYTINGGPPTPNHGEIYGPGNLPHVPMNGRLRAKGFKQGFIPSRLLDAQYTQARVAAPTFNPPAGSYPPDDFDPNKDVTISTTTPGGLIRFRLDGQPNFGQTFPSPKLVHVPPNRTLFARAEKQFYLNSTITQGRYNRQPKVHDITFDPEPGEFASGDFPLDVTVATDTPQAKIKWTINDTEVEANGHVINANHGVIPNVPANGVVRAFGYRPDWINSDIKTGAFNVEPEQVSKPTIAMIDLQGSRATIKISCSTPSASLVYRAENHDPPDPDPEVDPHRSNPYTFERGFPIGGRFTVKAMGFASGMENSQIEEKEFERDPNGN